MVSADGIRPDPEKTRAVSDFPVPQNVKDLRTFLGLCTYFRKFISGFSHIAEPLNQLLRRDASFEWGPHQETSFETLKTALTPAPVLGHFVEGADTEIRTDASGHGIGAVLAQSHNGQQRVIAYASRTLNKSERNFSTTEKECLAVIWAVSKFRPYLYGSPFRIVTDHHALCWLASLKDPSGRLGRWTLKLQDYLFTVVYKSGKRHLDADGLSRCPLADDTTISLQTQTSHATATLDNIDMASAQLSDDSLKPLIHYLQGVATSCTQRTKRRARLFIIQNNVLYRRNYEPQGRQWLLVVPRQLQKQIIQANHDDPTAGHLGFAKTYFRIRSRFFWTGMHRTINKYVRACHSCQTKKRPTTAPPGPLRPLSPPNHPFERIGIDFLGPFPQSQAQN